MNETHQNAPQEQKTERSKLRKAGMKVLALCERARVAFVKHPVSPLLYVVILALVVGFFTFNGMYTKAYVLSIDGEEMGVVASEGDVEAMVAHVETRASSILGEEYAYDADIELTPALTVTGHFVDAAAVEDTMFANAGALTQAWAISVDGEELGYGAAEQDLRDILDQIAQPYFTEYTTGYDFVEDVRIYGVELPANTEYDLQAIFETLTVFTVEEAHYEVEAGDTFNQIAYSLDMSPADLSALNPGININKIMPGQQLMIRQAVPFLSVKTYENKTYEEAVPSPIEEIETPDLYLGYSKVKEQGEDGLARVNADITYVNGYEVCRDINTSETLEEPTTTYMYVGTTPKPKTASNGYYIYPTASHRVTSPYGYRTIFGVREFHLGIDLVAPYGASIKAADGGKVTFAGTKGSYGKLIIITHDDGSQTYYAHNSQLLVSRGDRVYQGQVIAKAGSTGRSTGPHCHFEIRINGHTVNPLNYL